ncbi:hypothetical protein Peur_018011 [Populus x canadensis]
MEGSRDINHLTCIRSKKISLSLDQISRQHGPPVCVKIRKARRHTRGGANTRVDSNGDNSSPSRLSLNNFFCKPRIHKKIRQVWVSNIGLLDTAKKTSWIMQPPFQILASSPCFKSQPFIELLARIKPPRNLTYIEDDAIVGSSN